MGHSVSVIAWFTYARWVRACVDGTVKPALLTFATPKHIETHTIFPAARSAIYLSTVLQELEDLCAEFVCQIHHTSWARSSPSQAGARLPSCTA
jgi:hypothetical protein